MELKQYQQAVLNDLAQYIAILKEQGSNHKAFSPTGSKMALPSNKVKRPFIPIALLPQSTELRR